MASVPVVLLDPRIVRHAQATWGVRDTDDAVAMTEFLNTRVGDGEEIACAEVVTVARKLNKKALRHLDCRAQLVEDTRRDERGES